MTVTALHAPSAIDAPRSDAPSQTISRDDAAVKIRLYGITCGHNHLLSY